MIRIDLVSHNRGRVGIDKDYLNALFAKGSGSLCAGIIKFARLTDYDGAASDNQNGADTSISWHFLFFSE